LSRPYAVIPCPADASLVASVLEAASRAHHREKRTTMPIAAMRMDDVEGLGRCVVIDRIERKGLPVPTPLDVAAAGPSIRNAIEQVHDVAGVGLETVSKDVVSEGDRFLECAQDDCAAWGMLAEPATSDAPIDVWAVSASDPDHEHVDPREAAGRYRRSGGWTGPTKDLPTPQEVPAIPPARP
jgi:hypothetical protein